MGPEPRCSSPPSRCSWERRPRASSPRELPIPVRISFQDRVDALLQSTPCAARLVLKVIDLAAAHERRVTRDHQILTLELLADVETVEESFERGTQLCPPVKGHVAAPPILHVLGHKGGDDSQTSGPDCRAPFLKERGDTLGSWADRAVCHKSDIPPLAPAWTDAQVASLSSCINTFWGVEQLGRMGLSEGLTLLSGGHRGDVGRWRSSPP